jgi:hypothetical protein
MPAICSLAATNSSSAIEANWPMGITSQENSNATVVGDKSTFLSSGMDNSKPASARGSGDITSSNVATFMCRESIMDLGEGTSIGTSSGQL